MFRLLRLRPLLIPLLRTATTARPRAILPPTRRYLQPRKFPVQPESQPGISADEYSYFADATLNRLFEALEKLAEERDDVDAEFSAGVLTLVHPKGTYVFNKQPPNRQIWLSSPVSGPKRYDFDEGSGEWVYARDGSSFKQLCKDELEVQWNDVWRDDE